MLVLYWFLCFFSMISVNSQCCDCCKCCWFNESEKSSKCHKEIDIADILKEEEKYAKNYLEIKKRYLEVVNSYSDQAKSLNDVTDVEINTEIILQHLRISEALLEIEKCQNVRDKVKKIKDIVASDYYSQIYNYENSNLKMPRCLIKHERNNCILESYFTILLGDPYFVKFYYLLNSLFEKNLLKQKDLPLVFEICKLFKNAVNNPKFTDKVSCLSILKAFFDNYKDHFYVTEKDEDGNLSHVFGGFQASWYHSIVLGCSEDEIKKYAELDKCIEHSFRYYSLGPWDIDINYPKLCEYLMAEDSTKKNIKPHKIILANLDKFPMMAMLVFAQRYHRYTYRVINGTFINYDSFNFKQPTPVSEREIIKLIANKILGIKNFNGYYPDYSMDINIFSIETWLDKHSSDSSDSSD